MVRVPNNFTTYDCGNGFSVDVVEERGRLSAWIYHQGYGVKECMFCVPEENGAKEGVIARVERTWQSFARKYALTNLDPDYYEHEFEEA